MIEEEDGERFVTDVADMTDEELMQAAEELDDWFQAQRRRYLVRPSTEVGPDGLTDEQIAEMADAMVDVLWAEHERIGPAYPGVPAGDRTGNEWTGHDQSSST